MKQTLGIFFLFLWSLAAIAQENSVTGTVTDANDGSPIPGVSVSIKGTTTGSVTSLDGVYSVTANQGDVLVFTFIGMKTIEATVSGSTLNVAMTSSTTDLDDVVVVGYGVKKKSLITGATSSVSAAEMSSSVTRAEQALQGKAPGVTATVNSGSPGNGMKVRIRGAGSNGKSDPLYIVDGMKTGDINYLNPADIESMEVLKDAASSAIYGTEGANGVVIIKTKTGVKGDAKINYDGQYGIQTMPKTPEMMNAGQYSTYMSEVRNWNKDKGIWEGLNNVPVATGEGTDWIEEISETAMMQTHNLSFSGGTDKGSYLVSTGYFKQDGVIGSNQASFERITSRVNLTQEVKKWLEVGVNVSYTNSKRNALAEDDGFNGVVNSALMMDPITKPVYAPGESAYIDGLAAAGNPMKKDENGNYYGVSENGFLSGEIYNPLLRIATTKGVTVNNKILANEYVKIMPFKGFDFTSRVGIDLSFENYHNWSPTFYGSTEKITRNSSASSNDQKWSTWLWENFATYKTQINDHSLTLMAGVSGQRYTYINLNTSFGYLPREDEHFAYPDYITSRENDIVGGGKSVQTMSSYFGRLSYDFKGKYLFEATVRRDGSSLFGSDNKYGTFPSFSAGWVASEESFWTIDAISFAKARLSWGQNGSTSNLGVDQYRSLISSTGVDYPDGTGVLVAGAEPDLLANSKLKWETSEQLDLGVDLRALNGMIYFTFDAYKKVTKDLLTLSTPALSIGNDPSYWNAGEVTNSGLEFLIGVQDKASDFSYDINANMSFMKNEVTQMNSKVPRFEGASAPTIGALTYMELNEPIYYFRGYKTAGIDPVTGDVLIQDVNGDGNFNEADMTKIGSPHPDFVLGSNINLGYKNFDLNIFVQGVFGQEIFKGFARADRQTANKQIEMFDERWTPTNTNASMPRAGYNDEKLYQSDLMVEDGSYVKIRQIQLGYTLPKTLLKKASIDNARFYVSLNDFFTFTGYSGLDPEVGSGNNNAQGIDYGTYPVSKKLLFGLSLSF